MSLLASSNRNNDCHAVLSPSRSAGEADLRSVDIINTESRSLVELIQLRNLILQQTYVGPSDAWLAGMLRAARGLQQTIDTEHRVRRLLPHHGTADIDSV